MKPTHYRDETIYIQNVDTDIYFLTFARGCGEITFQRQLKHTQKKTNKQNTQPHKEDALIDTKKKNVKHNKCEE